MKKAWIGLCAYMVVLSCLMASCQGGGEEQSTQATQQATQQTTQQIAQETTQETTQETSIEVYTHTMTDTPVQKETQNVETWGEIMPPETQQTSPQETEREGTCLDHTAISWTLDTARSDCLTYMVYTGECHLCGHAVEKTSAGKGEHTWNEWENTQLPTCSDEGQDSRACLDCGVKETRPIQPDGQSHDFGENKLQEVTPPYCNVSGEGYRYCILCKQNIYETIPATGEHILQDTYVYYNAYDHAKCCPCGVDVIYESHDFAGRDTCQGCGYTFVQGSEGLVYELGNDGLHDYYVLTGMGTCTDKDLVIPAYHGGIPVIKVAPRAMQNSLIESLYIPATVTDLESNAFAHCTALTKVTIEKTKRLSCANAFADCDALQVLDYKGDVASYLQNLNGCFLENGTDLYADGERVTVIDMRAMTNVGFWDQLAGCTSLETLILEEGITTVGDLNGCTALKALHVPASVTRILGLEGCTSLETLTFAEGCAIAELPLLNGCTSLKNICIPATVTELPAIMFKDCTSLVSVTFENGSQLSQLGTSTFENCTSLTAITLPTGVSRIPYECFKNCASLKEITLGEYITSVAYRAFYDCTSLEAVHDAEWLTEIGREAFSGCASLQAFHVSDKVPVIDIMTFYQCTSLKSVYLGKSLTAIDGGAFEGCEALTYVNFGGTLEDWLRLKVEDSYEYPVTMPSYYAGDLHIQGKPVTEVIVPEDVTTIANGLFMNCSSLKRVVISDRVDTISQYAFIYCSNLSYVTLGAGVQNVGGEAFFGCDKLTTIYNRSSLILTKGGAGGGYVANQAVLISAEPIDDDGMIRVDGLVFAHNGDNYVLVDYTGNATELVLPASINGERYAIGKSAFAYHPTLQKVTISSGVTEILNNAFYNAHHLTEVIFEEGVTSIGEYAFYRANLKKVVFPDSLVHLYAYAFQENTSLTDVHFGKDFNDPWTMAFALCPLENLSVSAENPDFVVDGNALIYLPKNGLIYGTYKTVIPDYVTVIAQDAFAYCSGLTNIVIPDSVTEIKARAFGYCEDLVSVTLPQGLTEIQDYCFAFCTSLKTVNNLDCIQHIGDFAFYQCESIENLVFSDALQIVDINAFQYCKNLKTITWGQGLTHIGWYAFNGCESLQAMTIPSGVKGIAMWTFAHCTSLQTVVFEGDLDYMDSNVFDSCISLETVVFKGKVDHIYASAFEGCISLRTMDLSRTELTKLGTGIFQNCSSLTQVLLPPALTEISTSLFEGCTALESIVIPEGVVTIGANAFNGCVSLQTVELPTTLTTIKAWAFADTTSLTHINLPKELTTIESYAFQNSGLREVTIPGGVTKIESQAFHGCKGLSKVIIQSGVQEISGFVFSSEYLRELYLPKSMTMVAHSAFSMIEGEHYRLDVYYEGNEQDKANIQIGEDNGLWDMATWHYDTVA